MSKNTKAKSNKETNNSSKKIAGIILDEIINDEEMQKIEETLSEPLPKKLPILPLKDIVLFPYMIYPILIGRNQSLKAVADAYEKKKFIFLTVQKNNSIDEPKYTDLYKYGTVCRILQVLKLPNNLLKVLVEGHFQGRLNKKINNKKGFLEADVEYMIGSIIPDEKEFEALLRKSQSIFEEYIRLTENLPHELISAYESIEEIDRKLFFAAANIKASIESKQKILESPTIRDKYLELIKVLNYEIEMLKMEDEIESKIQNTINKTQKKYYIQEQIRALQSELDEEDEFSSELNEIKSKIDKSGMHEDAMDKAYEELEKLQNTSTISPDYSVNRNYLDLMISLPWKEKTKDNLSIDNAINILDRDHYDMDKPKERILEYIALLNVTNKLKRQILCMTGPPGVGKTSLARSIANALGRKFVRFSLGGIRDESEIRGHRRTYVGSMPGKIIQLMKKAGTINPVILLDEIDKMQNDFRGDPGAALLEVLDPEQNSHFNDNYLEVDYDLSNVLFITTANVKYDIPAALLDRMDFIELNSYLDFEKQIIAQRYIIPKLLHEFGIDKLDITFKVEAIKNIINDYTRESGVRNLERQIASVLRQLTKEIVNKYYTINPGEIKGTIKTGIMKLFKKEKFVITPVEILKYLKTPIYKGYKDNNDDKVGVATGLAWTSVGGEILPIEVAILQGNEKLILTGKLGDVMKESAAAALTYLRANSTFFGLKADFAKKREIHIHIPEGAIPKDGPSAGIAITSALLSAFSGKAIRGDVAMTGEITLRGNVLTIGGLNEKLLAAKRNGIKTVVIPEDNKPDLIEMKKEILENLEIKFVKNYSQALPFIFRDFNAQSK